MMQPFLHLLQTALNDRDKLERIPVGYIDDASRLNQTRVTKICTTFGSAPQIEAELRTYLQEARSRKLALSIAGTRHTMGGQTFTPDGLILDMLGQSGMQLDTQKEILHVQAGACWCDILPYLHKHGRSIKIMQANNSFSVGGSLSANCHGWQPLSPPIASQVLAFRLLLADGTLVRCSREEQAELFSLVLGGYGLFGILLDAELAVTTNELYSPTCSLLSSADYPAFYQNMLEQQIPIGLAYGRLSVESGSFLREILSTIYTVLPSGPLPALSKPGLGWLRRLIFRGSVGSAYGKALRWNAEKRWGQYATKNGITRNHLLNEGVEIFQNRSRGSTDILHEYFIPLKQLEVFLKEARRIIPTFKIVDLLNVTIRFVAPDPDSFLRYADQEMFALVMLFNQSRSSQAEQEMAEMTSELIEAALATGGRYYLPYRLHASIEQFQRAYPQATQFFQLKRRYDPEELFQNEFYRKYGNCVEKSYIPTSQRKL